MVAFSPLRPGAWLMRRLKLPGKLGWCAAQSLVAVVLAVMAAPWWLTAVACILMLYVQLVLWLTLSHDMALVARSMQQTTQGDLTAHASLQPIHPKRDGHRAPPRGRRRRWRGRRTPRRARYA